MEDFTEPQVLILATTFAGLVTTLATLLFQFVREGRRHEWEVEAARRHAVESRRATEERETIAKQVADAEVLLNAKLDENTEISRQAFNEANHVNEKIIAQGEAFDRLLLAALASSPPVSPALDAVKSTVDETAEKVTDIHERVVEGA